MLQAPALDPPTSPVCLAPLAPVSAIEPPPLVVTGPPTASTSWAKVASVAPKTPHSLKFVQPIFVADSSIIPIPSDLLAVGHKKYSMCLVGQFIGNSPKIGSIHAVLNKLWGRHGEVSVSTYKDGLFLFQLPNDAAYSRALYRGPWHVQLKNVPFEMLTFEGLSYLASALGTPLHSDQDCSRLFKGDRANVCIDVDFSKPLQSEVIVDINGEHIEIEVSYYWKPQFCDNCHNWCHHALACSSKQQQTKWIPKGKVVLAKDPIIPVPSKVTPIATAEQVKAPAAPIPTLSTFVPVIASTSKCSNAELCSSPDAHLLIEAPVPLPLSLDVNNHVAEIASLPDIPPAASPKKPRATSVGVGQIVQQLVKPKQKRGRGAKNKPVASQVSP
ncbi:hypothetical protein Tsubulata_036146 [Turnera subulata]|uniref:DUF4283 domain-containing protein n=1 Tax=Turnera subulata TaxID=218843 RepID=A0A9Q0G1H4_9ROSI|nr:hypothetical protein Tsubulata_036146 [Turnera subulata]